MKKTILSIILLTIFANKLLYAQIPNAGFETWANNEPAGWITLNLLSLLGFPLSAEQTVDKRSGTSALKLSVKEYSFLLTPNVKDTLAGFCITGKTNGLSEDDAIPGFAYNGRPTSLTGYFKFNITKPDTGLIALGFSKWDPVKKEADSLGGTLLAFNKNTPNYTSFSAPIFYKNNVLPDTAVIYIFSSIADKPIPGTTLFIDDLGFVGGTASTVAGLSELKTITYPNPARSEVNISQLDRNAESIQILDMAGKAIETLNITEPSTMTLPLDSYNNGMYIYEIKDASERTLQRGRFVVSK